MVSTPGGHARLFGFASPGRIATVLLFIAHDCPICNSYAPEIARIVRAYTPKGIAVHTVYAEQGLTMRLAKRHAAEYGLPPPGALDSHYAISRRAGATITPEAVVYDSRGWEVYRGRIDNMYAGLGIQRPAPTVRDLRKVLDDLIAHRRPSESFARPVGCFIPTR